MSKAEERALEKYPLMADDDKEGLEALKYIGMECECASVFNEAQEAKQAYFIEGYNQAEKDLSDISWIKEVSGVKDMSRAKEEALKAFPPRSIAANYDTIDRRDAFEYGYLKAEKDLELGWEDIPKIFSISEQLKTSWWLRDNEQTKLIGTQVFWEEVLRRFNEQRHEDKNV